LNISVRNKSQRGVLKEGLAIVLDITFIVLWHT
jgi:hypothetical protein